MATFLQNAEILADFTIFGGKLIGHNPKHIQNIK